MDGKVDGLRRGVRTVPETGGQHQKAEFIVPRGTESQRCAGPSAGSSVSPRNKAPQEPGPGRHGEQAGREGNEVIEQCT